MSYVQCYHSVDNEYSLNHLLLIWNSILDHGSAVETVYIIWGALDLGKHPFLLLNGTLRFYDPMIILVFTSQLPCLSFTMYMWSILMELIMLYVVEIVFSWSTLVDHIWENDTNSPQTSFIVEVVKEMRDLRAESAQFSWGTWFFLKMVVYVHSLFACG